MGCAKCELYSFSLRRCRTGKVNPKTKKGTKETIDLMGLSYICKNNKFRQKIFDELVKTR